MSKNYLYEVVKVTKQFQRSINIDADYGNIDSLKGYICQGTAKSVLENTAKQILESNQRAFTWTGPYGGGKSSLALGLCSLVNENELIRTESKKLLGLNLDDPILKIFNASNGNWLVIPIVGRRNSIVQSIYHAYLNAKKLVVDTSVHITPQDLLKLLKDESDSKKYSGILTLRRQYEYLYMDRNNSHTTWDYFYSIWK